MSTQPSQRPPLAGRPDTHSGHWLPDAGWAPRDKALPGADALSMGALWRLVRASVQAWIDDGAPSRGAALAYYTLFSMAPLMLIVIAVAGMWFGEDAARGEIYHQLSGLMGSAGALAVQELLQSAHRPAGGAWATALGIGLMVIGATTVFAELQSTLDAIWRAPTPAPGGLWQLLRARLLSFGLILGLGFLLIVSLLLAAAMAALQKLWTPWFEGWELLAEGLNLLLNFGLMALLFAMIYKIMPRVRIAWLDVWVGAVVTALLFTLGRALIGWYLATGAVASSFGAAGSLVLVLAWVYYSAQIFLLGAEFTWVYAHTFGSRRHARHAADAASLLTRPASP